MQKQPKINFACFVIWLKKVVQYRISYKKKSLYRYHDIYILLMYWAIYNYTITKHYWMALFFYIVCLHRNRYFCQFASNNMIPLLTLITFSIDLFVSCLDNLTTRNQFKISDSQNYSKNIRSNKYPKWKSWWNY